MSDIHNVCLIDCKLSIIKAFENAGFNVLRLCTGDQLFFDLKQALAEHSFVPDMVVQIETLIHRSLVTGLDSVDCPTLFWAMDPHLNAYWQSAYGRLFDIVCSTQRGWIPRLKEQGVEDVRWLPMFGGSEAWTDMNERNHDISFVGRVSDQRPARKWMVDYLRKSCGDYHLGMEHSLSFPEMMALYRDSRIIPNESILGEVNFRLFEAASCGCMVLSQSLGDEQETLFEPGREFDTYENIVELDEKLTMYLKNERLTQTMGRAAYERIASEHMPVHRMESLVAFAKDGVSCRATGADVEKWTVLASILMWEAGLLPLASKDLFNRLQALEQDADVAAAMFRVQATSGMKKVMADNVRTILGANLYADSPDLNLAGSMASLRVGHWDGAKAFWYRHLKGTAGREPEPPKDTTQLLTLWAKDLKRRDCIVRAGFPFNVDRHLPASASDCLLLALNDVPEHLPTLRLLDTMLRPIVGLEQLRVGFLSILTLHEREDWRLAFEIALANLKSYRLVAGMEELHMAREIAHSQGQESMFDRALLARDASGLLAARLGT